MIDDKRLKMDILADSNNIATFSYILTIDNILNPISPYDEKVLPNPDPLLLNYLKYRVLLDLSTSSKEILAEGIDYSMTAIIDFNSIAFPSN